MPAPDDQAIWQSYAQRVKKLAKSTPCKPAVKPAAKPPDVKLSASAIIPHPVSAAKPHACVSLNTGTVFDRKTERQWRDGHVMIDGRIDLHGLTQAKAHAALTAFIHKHTKAGQRRLLIITGKGRGNQGVLRANLQGWLEALPEAPQMLALRPAAAKHGGGGAFYLLLKKPKI